MRKTGKRPMPNPKYLANRGFASLLILLAFPSIAFAHSDSEREEESHSDEMALPTVSLTFDDSHASHRWVAEALSRREMVGTFYVNSPRIGNDGYLDKEDLWEMEALGHEIGGHTLHHPALAGLDEDAQLREICDDRAELLSWGLSIRSLAYPFNSFSPSALLSAERCGYLSARGAAGIAAPGSCFQCPPSESIPPRQRYRLRSFPSYRSWMDIETVKAAIEAAGDEGWLILVFHDLCDDADCASDYSIPKTEFLALLDWMKDREVETKTVSEIVSGPVEPAVQGPPVQLPERIGKNLLRNPGLLGDHDGNGMPDCWTEGGFGDRSGSLRHFHQGEFGFTRIAVTEWDSGDHKFLSARGACAPEVRGGEYFRIAVHHRTRGHVRLVAYYRNVEGEWRWWAQSPPLERLAEWSWASWQTPALPPDAAAIQVGLSLRSQGWVDARYFTLEPLGPEPLPSCASAPFGLLLAGLVARRLGFRR